MPGRPGPYGAAEGPQDLEPAATRGPHQPERVLSQLVGLLGFQPVDQLMQVAVVMRSCHFLSVRQSRRLDAAGADGRSGRAGGAFTVPGIRWHTFGPQSLFVLRAEAAMIQDRPADVLAIAEAAA